MDVKVHPYEVPSKGNEDNRIIHKVVLFLTIKHILTYGKKYSIHNRKHTDVNKYRHV